ncbi:MAG: hypothetical protein ACYTG7_12880 [Planctomycetota bacterium]|jgi:hypothetical protein
MLKKNHTAFGFVLFLLIFILGFAQAQSIQPLGSDLEQARSDGGEGSRLWQQLEAMNLDDKANALIGFEARPDLEEALLAKIDHIENLWNTGEFDEAINQMRLLEKSGGPSFALGIEWKVPKSLNGGPDWGQDSQVDIHGSSFSTSLDFHVATGNLFSVIGREQVGSDQTRWSVNMSTDGGLSWNETYAWSTPNPINDVDAVVVSNYLYVAYVADDVSASYSAARMRRFGTSNGAVDNIYNFKVVFDNGVDINEVALESNVDGGDGQVYYYAIQSNNHLIYHWATSAGTPWFPVATGVTNASVGLDVCFNEDGAVHFNMASYITTSGRVNLVLRDGWTVKDFEDSFNTTAVAAYQDRIIVAYQVSEASGTGIKYRISYNGGSTFAVGWIAMPLTDELYFSPDLTGRRGGGFAVIYNEEVGEPDPTWYRHRDYDIPVWSNPVTFNEVDTSSGWDNDVEWLPAIFPSDDETYGAVWISDWPVNYSFFDRVERPDKPLFADTFTLEASSGGTVNFSLDAGAGNGFRNYLMLGGVSGIDPGFILPGGLPLPVNWDAFTDVVVSLLNTAVFQNFLGALNGAGISAAQLNSGALDPQFVGINMYYAFCLNAPFDYVSNPVSVRIVP